MLFPHSDYSDNVTNIITHMRMAVKEPERTNNAWLTNLWGGWGYWLFNTVLPIVGAGLVLLLCLPCIFQFVSSSVWRLAKSSVTHQLLKMTVYPEDMFLDMGNEKATEEETISSISYNEMKQSEVEP